MPYDSSLEAGSDEVEMSQVYQLLDELDGKPIDLLHAWRGYDKRVYNKTMPKQQRDTLVARLCGKLQEVDLTKYSLEMQMWWRDRQLAGAARMIKEEESKRLAKEREIALAKLTPSERALLRCE